MTAVAVARPGRLRTARAMRLEIKHSPVVWALPALGLIFYLDTYRTAVGQTPTWAIHASFITGHMLTYICVFGAGLGAWAGTREGRRRTGDLLATTARAAWARQATVLAATAFWLVLAFLAETAAIYVQTAGQATWGGPPLWPVAVGVVCTITACAIGFTAGTLFPGRFTAPIIAVVVFVLEFVGFKAVDDTYDFRPSGGSYALLTPGQGLPHNVEAGVFYRIPPDVSIAQLIFMGGLLLVAAGLLALSPAARVPGVRGLSLAAAGGRALAVLAAVAVAAGVAASATAYSLAGTAQQSSLTGSWEIPALHDAASDRPVPYTPVCASAAFPVCVHPAFDGYLDAVSAALQPAAAEVAGLPGAPVRAELAVDDGLPAPAGTTSVYAYSGTGAGSVGGSWFGAPPGDVIDDAIWTQGYQQSFLFWFVSGPVPSADAQPNPDPAQQAVADALLAKIGAPAPDLGPPQKAGGPPPSRPVPVSRRPSRHSATQIAAAASRFGSLSSAARRGLADDARRRAALRRDHAGADPVTAASPAVPAAGRRSPRGMTAAEVKTPPVPPASPAGSAAAARRAVACARLAWLHLRSRRGPAAIAALAACAVALRAVLHWQLTFSGAAAQQIPMIIEAGAAVVIAVTTHSPFGEAERTTGRWLPYLRLGAVLALTGAAIGLLQLGVTGASLNDGVLTLARNVIGLTGIGLLTSLVTGGLLAWVLPLGYVGFAEYALAEAWRNPWTWPARPPTDRGAWICAALVFAAGLLACTVNGARTRLADDA